MIDQLGMGLLISLKDAFSRNAGTIRNSAMSLDSGMASVAQSITRSTNHISGGLKMMVGGAGALAFPTAAIASTLDTQKALGELASEGVKDLRSIEDAATRFTNKWAGYNKAEFIGAAYTIKGALNNLSDEAVGTATEMAALTAKATKASIADMTEAFSVGYGIFKKLDKDMTDQEWFSKFSGAFAQTVLQFKTEGSSMSMALSRLGDSGTNLEIPMVEQLSVLGQLQTTMGAERAGTYYKAFIKQVVDGGRALGVQVVGSNNRLLSTVDIINNLKARYKDFADPNVANKISKAFGSDEAMMFVNAMKDGVDTLPENMRKIEEALRGGASTTEAMAMAMDSNIWGVTTVFRQRIRNLVEEAGNSMIPIVRPIAQAMADALGSVGKLMKQMPLLTGAVMTAATGFGLLLVTAGAARFAIGGITYSWVALKIGALSAQKTVVASLVAIQTAAWAANHTMGLGMTIPEVNFGKAGIGGGLKQFAQGLDFGDIGGKLFGAADGASRKLLSRFWGGLKQAAPNTDFAKIGDVLSSPVGEASRRILSGFRSGIKNTAQQGRGALSGMWEGIKSGGSAIKGDVPNTIAHLRTLPGALSGGFKSLFGTVKGFGPILASAFSLGGIMTGISAVGGAISGAIAAVASIPAWPVIGAIALISAGLYSLWNVMRGAWGGFMSVMGPTLSVLGEQLAPVIGEIRKAFSMLMSSFGGSMGQDGLGGTLKSIGQVLGWMVGNVLSPIVRIIGVGLYVALKSIAFVIRAVEWAVYGLSTSIGYVFRKLDFVSPAVKFVKNMVAGIKTWGWEITKAIMSCIPGGNWIVNKMFPDMVKDDSPNITKYAQSWSKANVVPRFATAAALSVAPMLSPGALISNQDGTARQQAPIARTSFRPIQGASTSEQHQALLDRVDRLASAVEQQADRPIVVKTALDGKEVASSVANQQRLKAVRNYE